MSGPKRLKITGFGWPSAGIKDESEWVGKEDYDNVASEVKRLKDAYDNALAQLNFSTGSDLFEENIRLKAEVDEYRKDVTASVDTLIDERNRLKAEVERLTVEKDQAECDYDNCQKRKVSIDNHRFDLFTENKNLKAEVERLHKYVETMERESMSDEYEINNQTRIINGLLTEKEQLKAENERLRKAGDEMAEGLLKYIEPTDGYLTYLECRAKWNAAKEGKPSV